MAYELGQGSMKKGEKMNRHELDSISRSQASALSKILAPDLR